MTSTLIHTARVRAAAAGLRTALVLAAMVVALVAPASAQRVRPGDILVTSPAGNTANVVCVDPISGEQFMLTWDGLLIDGGAIGPYGITVDALGDIYVSSVFGNQAVRIDPVTGRQTLVTSGDKLLWPEGVAAAPNGVLYFAESLFGPEPLDPNGVSDQFGGSVVRYDPASGQQTLVSTGQYFWTIGPPNAIARAADGRLLATLPNTIEPFTGGALVSIAPDTGEQTLLAQGGNFIGAERLAIDASGAVFVTSVYGAEGLPVIVRIDPVTHEPTVVMSGYLLGTSPEQGNASPPQGIAVAADGSLVVVGAGAQSPVVRVDPTTGQQTLISPGGATSLLMIPEDLALYPQLPGRTIVATGGHEWSAAAWDDGSGTLTSPAAGDRAVVENGAAVAVLLDHSADLPVDSLSLYVAALDVAPAAKLVVEGQVAIVGGSWLNVDGELVADEVVDGLRQPQYEPNVLSGSGTITARRVVIGGVLAPGSLGEAVPTTLGRLASGSDAAAATVSSEIAAPVPEPGSAARLLLSIVFSRLFFRFLGSSWCSRRRK